MGIIQCAEQCKFQKDGYCSLDKCSTVSSVDCDCPYFISLDNRNSLFETPNPDKLQ